MLASLVLHMAQLPDSVAPWVFCLELSVLPCNNNASRYKVMYVLNVHSCCHLVIDLHILVSPNDGCPCMWSGVVCQGNLDSALREVPYTPLRRTAGRQGLSPPRLITRAHSAASLAFPWLKTCYNCWWVLCMYNIIFNDITHGKIIYPGAMSHICTHRYYTYLWCTYICSSIGSCATSETWEMHDCPFFLWAPRLYQYGHSSHLLYINMKRDKRKYEKKMNVIMYTSWIDGKIYW